MTKYPYILFVLLLASFSSCQTVEQLSIDYMLPAEISFPNELKRVAVVNNVSDTPDNTLPPKDNTIKNKNELSRAVAYHEGQPALTTEALAKAIAEQNYFNEVVICDSALRASSDLGTVSGRGLHHLTGKPADEIDTGSQLHPRMEHLLRHIGYEGLPNAENLSAGTKKPDGNHQYP